MKAIGHDVASTFWAGQFTANRIVRFVFFVASRHGTKRGRSNVLEVRGKKAIRKYLAEGWKEDKQAVCVALLGAVVSGVGGENKRSCVHLLDAPLLTPITEPCGGRQP